MWSSRVFVWLTIVGGCKPSTTPITTDIDCSVGASDAASQVVDVGGDAPLLTHWGSLFDGVSLEHWLSYLGKPGHPHSLDSNTPPLGLDCDPQGVFTIVQVDGEPAIRVSGEVWGSLISKDVYENYTLSLEYKWGEKVWPDGIGQDSGIMYHSIGPLGAVDRGNSKDLAPPGAGSFMVSLEYQLVPWDIGHLYNLGPIDKSEASLMIQPQIANDWNRVDIEVRGASSVHKLNGKVVHGGKNFASTLAEPPEIVSAGKLQLQSEGSEVFFRHIVIIPIE